MNDSKKLATLSGWLERGWSLVPLHNVVMTAAGQACTCYKGTECGRSMGKHPRFDAWWDSEQLVANLSRLRGLAGQNPDWNWGAATGEPSNMWVLDWDIEHDQTIGSWFIEHGYDKLESISDTLTLGPTGGGGRHFVFELPRDFVPRNSQSKNRRGLPTGLDIRGYHGQIVIAPSVSYRGAYGGVLLDRPIKRAPDWLEDIARPVEYEQPEYMGIGALEWDPNTGGEGQRAAAYAHAAVGGELDRLRAAAPGTRDDTAVQVAYRLIEIGNAAWSGLSLEQLKAWWWEVRMSIADGAHVAAGLDAQWARAVARVAGRAAELPVSYSGSELLPFEPAGAGLPGQGPVTGSVTSGVTSVSPPTLLVTPEVTLESRIDQLARHLLSAGQVAKLPNPRPLINGVLDLNSTAWLLGKRGSLKSFVALDMADHVARGEPWLGHRTARGRVVYLVAEGVQGMKLRLAAIDREYGSVPDELLFLPLPVKADERAGAGDWTALVMLCNRIAPVLIVIDTQSRVAGGLDENSNGDMSILVEQMDRLKTATGATVLVVHHEGKGLATGARGASSLEGGADSVLRIERQAGAMVAKLLDTKQKDQAENEGINFMVRRSEGGTDPETGRDLSSLVVCRGLPLADPEPAAETVAATRMRALYELILDRWNAGDGGTKADIRNAFRTLPEIEALNRTAQLRAWDRAWSGTEAFPGLVPRRLILKSDGMGQRFKVISVPRELWGDEGCLTPLPSGAERDALIPMGWGLWEPDREG